MGEGDGTDGNKILICECDGIRYKLPECEVVWEMYVVDFMLWFGI